MSWLDNPVANMYGPHFLLFYAAVNAVTLSALWYLLRHWDPTAGLPPPPVPTEPDPYAIANLRGGMDEVARVAVFELLQRGYLTGEDGVFEKAKDTPDLRHLLGVARVAYEWFRTKGALSVREVFGAKGLATKLRDEVEPRLRQPQEAERLLATDEMKSSRRWLAALAAILILGLGGYKLTVALTKGHTNVLFLIAMLLAALVAVVRIYGKTPSLTARGRKYLDAVTLAFRPLTDRQDTGSVLPLLVGLLGVAALAGTTYAYYADELEQFQRAARSASFYGSGSCGDGCGGDCGGGCGGGCGGCGD